MAGTSAITGLATGLASTQISAQVQLAAVARTKDALELQGQAALKLIESAVVDPDVGQSIDVRV